MVPLGLDARLNLINMLIGERLERWYLLTCLGAKDRIVVWLSRTFAIQSLLTSDQTLVR